MLKRLRIKIVALIMVLVGLVLTVSVVLGPVQLYAKLNQAAGDVLRYAAEIGPEALSLPQVGKRPSDGGAMKDLTGALQDLSGSSYAVYCASISDDGVVLASNESSVSMSSEVLTQAIREALASQDDFGRLDNLRVMYARFSTGDGYNVAFLDTGLIDANLETSLFSALWRLAAALAVLLCIAVGFARYVTRPVAEAWKQQQRFVADASHELKTPLTVILASADIMKQHPEKTVADQANWLASIEDEGRRMKKLVEELLAAARAGEQEDAAAAHPEHADERVDLTELVERSCLQFDAVAFDKGIDFTWEVAPGLACMGEADGLERLVRILLDNAMKYAGPEGAAKVQLEADKRGGKIVATVRNTGDPIDPEVLPHVFDRFYRADASRTDGSSFGLGLFIAQSIARRCKGELTVTSTAEEGTAFTCTLPAA